jgi:hypothetical protein
MIHYPPYPERERPSENFIRQTSRPLREWFVQHFSKKHLMRNTRSCTGPTGVVFDTDILRVMRTMQFVGIWIAMENRGYNVPFALLKWWYMVRNDCNLPEKGFVVIPTMAPVVASILYGVAPWSRMYGATLSRLYMGITPTEYRVSVDDMHPSLADAGTNDHMSIVSMDFCNRYYHYRICPLWCDMSTTRYKAKQAHLSPCPRCALPCERPLVHSHDPVEIKTFGIGTEPLPTVYRQFRCRSVSLLPQPTPELINRHGGCVTPTVCNTPQPHTMPLGVDDGYTTLSMPGDIHLTGGMRSVTRPAPPSDINHMDVARMGYCGIISRALLCCTKCRS